MPKASNSKPMDTKQLVEEASSQSITTLAQAIGKVSPFYLIYRGLDDSELQSLYGEIICQVMAKKYPQWSYKRSVHLPQDTEIIRIGIRPWQEVTTKSCIYNL